MTAWNENEQAIKNWLLKQTGNSDQTQDLLQDLFIKAMQNKERFCTLTDAKSWLFKVCKNSLIDSYRESYRKTHLQIDTVCDQLDITGEHNKDENDNRNTPLLSLQNCLVRVISELNEEDKQVIEQCDMQGLSQAEYAKKYHLTLSATKSRIQRARKKLRQQMVLSCNVKFDHDKVCCFTPRQ
tara:strand:- start:3573 stop:4121 length:549 start_codon:yes stop_codon:yes gene_type:complete